MTLYFIITGYNCAAYLADCFGSLVLQTSDNWHAVYVDDASDDPSIDIARAWQRKYPDKFTLLTNRVRLLKTAGFLKAIEYCPFDSIVAELDGDDALLSP